jgi:tetratricopeptide (TPR) repeat protein
LDLGRETEAAARFEAAHAIRPDDPNALTELSLARTIQGRFEEAMAAAQAALDGEPRADHAVAYLLQAAARSDWTGDPESLIPEDLVGTAHADIGLAEYLRRRDAPGWAERSLKMARRHADTPEFKRIRAIAVLSLAIDSAAIVPGGRGPVTTAELNDAANDMKTLAENRLDVNFADVHDLVAHVNNAAVLLRLCDRHDESEALLLRGLSIVGDEPQLLRLLALSQSAQDRGGEALATLAGDTDPENRLLSTDLQASTGDIAGALQCARPSRQTDYPSGFSGFAGAWWGSFRSVSVMKRISRPPSWVYARSTRPTSRRAFWRSGGRGKRPRTRRSSTTG